MKKAIIHYFTGTGNTAHAAGVMKQELEKAGFKTESVYVKKGMKPPEGPYDYHIILFPVFALTIPYAFDCYLRKMPAGHGSKAAVIANHAMINEKGGIYSGYESQAPLVPGRILKRKGYEINIIGEVGYPENLTIVSRALRKETIDAVIEAGDKKIRILAQKIIKGEKSIKRYNILDLTLGWLFGFLFVYFGRWQFGKFYTAGKNCNQCGVCVRACPAGAVRLYNKKPRWNYRCEGCLGCYNYCPQTAIQISIIRLAVLLFFNFWPLVYVIQNYSKIISFTFGWLPAEVTRLFANNMAAAVPLGILLYIIIALAGIYLSDKLFFLMEQMPFVRNIFQWTYTKKLRRYTAPDFKPLKEI